eukprot:13396932-Alexandrium_andersonii.AAC.1
MSASLVGSEMCIRDRFSLGGPAQRCGAAPRDTRGRSWREEAPGSRAKCRTTRPLDTGPKLGAEG